MLNVHKITVEEQPVNSSQKTIDKCFNSTGSGNGALESTNSNVSTDSVPETKITKTTSTALNFCLRNLVDLNLLKIEMEIPMFLFELGHLKKIYNLDMTSLCNFIDMKISDFNGIVIESLKNTEDVFLTMDSIVYQNFEKISWLQLFYVNDKWKPNSYVISMNTSSAKETNTSYTHEWLRDVITQFGLSSKSLNLIHREKLIFRRNISHYTCLGEQLELLLQESCKEATSEIIEKIVNTYKLVYFYTFKTVSQNLLDDVIKIGYKKL